MNARAAVPVSIDPVDLSRQHHALRVEIAELRGMIDSRLAPQRNDRYHAMLAVLVGRLGDRLRSHFEAEECDGYLAALAADPALADDLDRLCAAHATLVGDALHLSDVLRAPDAPPDAVARVLRWLDLVQRHEADEHDVVQRHLPGA
jgi:hypothetical protein